MRQRIFLVSFLCLASAIVSADNLLLNGNKLPFYIYHGFRATDNHFYPSGWMGDANDLRFDDRWKLSENPTKKVIRIVYSAQSIQRNGWAGIYWQNPPNNWGSRPGGFNLNGAKQLVFSARGEEGGEVVEFKVGGIGGNFADSGSASLGPVTLSKEWRNYNIDLQGQELSSISGGFCCTVNGTDNPKGATFYIDDIRFE